MKPSVNVYSGFCILLNLKPHPESRCHPEDTVLSSGPSDSAPAAVDLCRFRSQSSDTAHSAAAQHAAVFICVCCRAGLCVQRPAWPPASNWRTRRASLPGYGGCCGNMRLGTRGCGLNDNVDCKDSEMPKQFRTLSFIFCSEHLHCEKSKYVILISLLLRSLHLLPEEQNSC